MVFHIKLPNYFKTFLAFWIFIFLFKFGAGLHYSLLSPLGATILPTWLVGFLIGGASIFQLLLDVPAGFLLDRKGYIRLLKFGTAAFLLAASALLLGLSQVTFIITLFLGAMGWLFFGPGINAYILSQAPVTHSGRFMSLRDTAGAVGITLSMVALAFVVNLSPPVIGGVILALLGGALVAVWLAPPDKISVHTVKKTPTHHYYIRRQFLHQVVKSFRKLNPASGFLVFLNLGAGIFYGTVWFTVPIAIAQATAGDFWRSIGLGTFDLAIVLLGFILGKLADTYSRKRLVFLGLLIFAAAGTALGFHAGIWFIVLAFLATTGHEMANVSLWAWLNHLDKNHAEDALVAGTITLAEDLGWAIGPAAAGLLLGALSAPWTIAVSASFLILTWLIYAIAIMKPPATFPHNISFHHLPPPRFQRHKE